MSTGALSSTIRAKRPFKISSFERDAAQHTCSGCRPSARDYNTFPCGDFYSDSIAHELRLTTLGDHWHLWPSARRDTFPDPARWGTETLRILVSNLAPRQNEILRTGEGNSSCDLGSSNPTSWFSRVALYGAFGPSLLTIAHEHHRTICTTGAMEATPQWAFVRYRGQRKTFNTQADELSRLTSIEHAKAPLDEEIPAFPDVNKIQKEPAALVSKLYVLDFILFTPEDLADQQLVIITSTKMVKERRKKYFCLKIVAKHQTNLYFTNCCFFRLWTLPLHLGSDITRKEGIL